MLFSRGQVPRDGVLEVDPALRFGLGIHDGSHLSVVAMTDGHGAVPGFSEFIASPVASKSWHDIWRLDAVFSDRPGIISDVSQLLSSLDIDVLGCKSTTFVRDSTHIDMQLDLKRYESALDQTSAIRKDNPLILAEELVARVWARFSKDLNFLGPDEPQLSIRRNQVLYKAHSIGGTAQEVCVERGCIEVASFARSSPDSDLATWYFAADPDHLALHVYMANASAPALHVRLGYQDVTGALFELTSVLKSAGFSVLQCFSRASRKGRFLVDLLIYLQDSSNFLESRASRYRVRESVMRKVLKAIVLLPRERRPELKFPPTESLRRTRGGDRHESGDK